MEVTYSEGRKNETIGRNITENMESKKWVDVGGRITGLSYSDDLSFLRFNIVEEKALLGANKEQNLTAVAT